LQKSGRGRIGRGRFHPATPMSVRYSAAVATPNAMIPFGRPLQNLT
jgi:hypothetical protein